jgi:hypothetical protein
MEDQSAFSPSFASQWADKIRQMGLAAPAILLLEVHKPLSFITGQFLLVSQPMLTLFFAAEGINNVITLLSDRACLEGFIKDLEQD